MLSECENNGGDTPLHVACKYGDIKMVQYLISECQCDPMSKNGSNDTPLHEACRVRCGDTEMVQYLIGKCRCDLKCKSSDANTLLHIAVTEYILSTAKIDPLVKNILGKTSLMIVLCELYRNNVKNVFDMFL